MTTRRRLTVATLGAIFAVISCSSGDGGANGGTNGMSTGNGGSSGSGGSNLDSCSASQIDSSGCVGERYEGENTPLDIYIMFDQSCSMSCPPEMTGLGLCCNDPVNGRINDVRDAVGQFLHDPRSNGIGVGIGYFGYMQPGNTSCDPSDYDNAAVGIAPLPDNANPIMNSLNAAVPTGETPTGAAIRGACLYASQWQSSNPGHSVVVLLVTDGVPEAPVTSQNGGCNPTLQDAVQAAGSCGQNPILPVYVLGVGNALDNLNQIAAAGGTDHAYLVSGADVSASVLEALNAIRANASIPCQLQIPTAPQGETLDYAMVNVGYCGATGMSQIFYYVENESQCDPDQGGWYYDNATNPGQILLCGATCGLVSAPGGTLFMSVGCAQQVMIR